MKKKMLIPRLSTSPAVMESHTPSISSIPGSIRAVTTMKIIVRQNDSISEDFPSFSAVNQPEANTLYAIMMKLVATMWKPCSAMEATFN